MKRRISLLLAVVMVLGSFASVFAANITPEEYVELAVETVTDAGILVGNSEGDLDLGSALKRKDSVVLMSRLLGQEDLAKEFGETEEVKKFKDLPNNKYYKSVISWGIAEAGFKGSTATTFRPDHSLTAAEYSKLLLEALGYKQDVDFTWSAVFEKAKELGLLKHVDAKEATDEVLRRDIAVMTFNALSTKVKGSKVTLAEKLGIAMPEFPGKTDEVEVKAISEKEIQVKFADKIAKDEQKNVKFIVKDEKDNEVKLNPIEWNKDGDKVTLKRNYNLKYKAGKYTVEIKGIELKQNIFEVEITEAKAQELIIKENVLSLGGKAEQALTVQTVDQYGVKKDANNVTLAAKNITDGKTIEINGNKLILAKDNKFLVKEGDIISVTALDSRTALSVTKELEIVAGSVIDEIVLGDVVIIGKNGKVVDTLIKGEGATAYVEINAFDQYEEKVKLDKDTKDVKFFASGLDKELKTADVETIKNNKLLDKDSQYVVIKDTEIKNDAKEVSMYAVIVRATGVQNSNVAKFDVEASGKVTDFSFDGVKQLLTEDEKQEVNFKFFDQYGREVKNPTKVKVKAKSSNDDVVKVEKDNQKVVELLGSVKDKDKSSEATVTFTLWVDGKEVKSEDMDFVVVKAISKYTATVDTTVKEFTAGDEIDVTLKAFAKGQDEEAYSEYNTTENVEITVQGQKYFRKANFDKGVAVVRVPLSVVQKDDKVVITTDLKGTKPGEMTGITVKPGKVEQFELKDGKILAQDKFGNTNDSYIGKKAGKATVSKGLEVEQIDNEGNLLLDFENGEAKFNVTKAGTEGNGKVTIELDGIKAEFKDLKVSKETEEPGTGEEKPGTGEEKPGTGEEKPGTGEEKPGTGDNK